MKRYKPGIPSAEKSSDRFKSIIRLWEDLLGIESLEKKLQHITDILNGIYNAALTETWIVKEGDRCNSGYRTCTSCLRKAWRTRLATHWRATLTLTGPWPVILSH